MDQGLAAILGAAIGFFGAVLVERFKARGERSASYLKELRQAIGEFATHVAKGAHAAAWLTWPAAEDPKGLTRERLDAKIAQYNKDMNGVFPLVTGALVQVAALDERLYKTLEGVVRDLEELDRELARGCSFTDRSLDDVLRDLRAAHDEVRDFELKLPERLADVAGTKAAIRARAWSQAVEPDAMDVRSATDA